jgi:hypothetical protein
VVVALVELGARRLGALRRVAGVLERLAGDGVDLLAVGAGADLGERAVERLAGHPPVLGELVGRLHAAGDEAARHVGPAARLTVARPDVDDHDLALADRPVAGLVADRRLRPVGDDHVVGKVAPVLVADRLHGLADRLAAGSALVDHPRADGHRLVGGPLRAADALDLRLGLHAPLGDEHLGVDEQLDPVRPQVVGEADGELRRHDRPAHAHLLAGAA